VLAVRSLHAAEESGFAPQHWWLVGPYARYSAADFAANEAIENDGRNNHRASQFPSIGTSRRENFQ